MKKLLLISLVMLLIIITLSFALSLILPDGRSMRISDTGEIIQYGQRAIKTDYWIDAITVPDDSVIEHAVISTLQKKFLGQVLTFRTNLSIEDLVKQYEIELINKGWSEVTVLVDEKIENENLNQGTIRLQSPRKPSSTRIFGYKDDLRIDITFSTNNENFEFDGSDIFLKSTVNLSIGPQKEESELSQY